MAGLKFNTEDLGIGKGSEIGSVDGGAGPSLEDISSKLNVVDEALNKIASERATLGSVQSRLGSALSNLAINVENMETAKSRIKDVDFASETAELTQARILTSSTTAVLQQANAAPEQVLQLLR